MTLPDVLASSSTGSFASPEEAAAVGDLVDAFDERCQAAIKAGEGIPSADAFLDQLPAESSAALRRTLEQVAAQYRRDQELPRVPGYEVLAEIDRGAMGVVYKAKRSETGRIVALKRLDGAEEDRVGRLDALLNLNHPNIVPVESWFRHDRRVYVVMEYVEGRNLKDRMAEFELPRSGPTASEVVARKQAIAALVERIAHGVTALHVHAVLHRDLKPGNVMIDKDGTPRVCDFGLMLRLDGTDPRTVSRAVVGTIPYMAPEQAMAGAGRPPLSVRADVYALGAILYELLTGHTPFGEKDHGLLDLLQLKAAATPHPVEKLNPASGQDCDLAWICMKCLRINPDERFATAADLAAALEEYQRGGQVRDDETMWHTLRRLTKPLELSPADPEYIERWKPTLRIEACTSFVCHLGMFLLASSGVAGPWVWLWFFATDPLTGWLDWWPFMRGRRLTPLEQQILQMWIGADLAAVILFMATVPLWGTVPAAAVAQFYVGYAVIRGLTFFIEGRTCWGRLYLVGLAFFAAALVMPWVPAYAPLIHGLMYSGWFIWLSFQNWRTTRTVG